MHPIAPGDLAFHSSQTKSLVNGGSQSSLQSRQSFDIEDLLAAMIGHKNGVVRNVVGRVDQCLSHI